ncbi:DUF1203 domain-containing protein [Dyella sp.]|uniref:DUF1203 domain-containing protein n=1 Tax=Dyella sp. TaxID=1869338 RepID=UPI002ED11E5F
MSFRLTGLPAEPFRELFDLTEEALALRRAQRMTAQTGVPCRISLTDATPGDEVILVNYEHQPAGTPYRASHAIFVRRDEQRFDAIDEIPAQLRRRLLSVRGFDSTHMLCAADVVEGEQLTFLIERLFDHAEIDYLHVHYARHGCYAARIDRV